MDKLETTPPDIESALRNPLNESAYRSDYNKLLTERAFAVVGDVLKDNPNKDETEKEFRLLLEGGEGSMILEGSVVKALSEGGLLRVASITGRTEVDAKDGWVERKRMSEWEKEVGHEVWGLLNNIMLNYQKKKGRRL